MKFIKKLIYIIPLFILTFIISGCSEKERLEKEYPLTPLLETEIDDPLDRQMVSFTYTLFEEQEELEELLDSQLLDKEYEEIKEDFLIYFTKEEEFLSTQIKDLKTYKEEGIGITELKEEEISYMESVLALFQTYLDINTQCVTLLTEDKLEELEELLSSLDKEETKAFTHWQEERNNYLSIQGFSPEEVKASYEKDLNNGIHFK